MAFWSTNLWHGVLVLETLIALHPRAEVCIWLTSVTVAHLASKNWTIARDRLIVLVPTIALNEALKILDRLGALGVFNKVAHFFLFDLKTHTFGEIRWGL